MKTPGISRYRPDVAALEDQGVAVVGGLGLWLEEADRDRVVVHHRAPRGRARRPASSGTCSRGLGHRCLVGGNIGRLPYDPDSTRAGEFTALEVSSFQATDLALRPAGRRGDLVAPRPPRLARQRRALLRRQAVAVHPARGRAHGRRRRQPRAPRRGGPARAPGRVGRTTHRPGWTEALGLLGCAQPPQRADRAGLHAGARACPRPATTTLWPRRHGIRRARQPALARSGRSGGVSFVDDSLSTNALAPMAALDAFEGRPVALIVGGADRGIDYAPLAERVAAPPRPDLRRRPCRPTASASGTPASSGRAGGRRREIHDTGDLDTAVRHGLRMGGAGRGDPALARRRPASASSQLPGAGRGLPPGHGAPPAAVLSAARSAAEQHARVEDAVGVEGPLDRAERRHLGCRCG